MGLGAAVLPWCPLNPSGVFQLWSFQRVGSARAPLCGHAPAWSASVSEREQEEKGKQTLTCQLGATKANKRRSVREKRLRLSYNALAGYKEKRDLLITHSSELVIPATLNL